MKLKFDRDTKNYFPLTTRQSVCVCSFENPILTHSIDYCLIASMMCCRIADRTVCLSHFVVVLVDFEATANIAEMAFAVTYAALAAIGKWVAGVRKPIVVHCFLDCQQSMAPALTDEAALIHLSSFRKDILALRSLAEASADAFARNCYGFVVADLCVAASVAFAAHFASYLPFAFVNTVIADAMQRDVNAAGRIESKLLVNMGQRWFGMLAFNTCTCTVRIPRSH